MQSARRWADHRCCRRTPPPVPRPIKGGSYWCNQVTILPYIYIASYEVNFQNFQNWKVSSQGVSLSQHWTNVSYLLVYINTHKRRRRWTSIKPAMVMYACIHVQYNGGSWSSLTEVCFWCAAKTLCCQLSYKHFNFPLLKSYPHFKRLGRGFKMFVILDGTVLIHRTSGFLTVNILQPCQFWYIF